MNNVRNARNVQSLRMLTTNAQQQQQSTSSSTAGAAGATGAQSASQAAGEGAESASSEISTNVTMTQRAKAGGRLMMLLGALGVVGGCAYYIGKELMPSKLSPNGAFNAVFEKVRNHPELVKYLGSNIKGYGRDLGGSREGRRNFIDHDEFADDDGVPHIRIKFNVEGQSGVKGVVYAELAKNAPEGHFEYVIFERPNGQGVISLIENRRELTREEIQEKVANKLAKANAVLFGHVNCTYTARQKMEFGDHFNKIRYVACDRPENETECKNAQLKGFPTCKFLKSFHFVCDNKCC